jgi:hypothetical protein
MHFGKIADMLWLSQVFENVNIPDTLEKSQVVKSAKKHLFARKVFKILDNIFLNNVFNLFILTLSQPYEGWQYYARGAPDHMATV